MDVFVVFGTDPVRGGSAECAHAIDVLACGSVLSYVWRTVHLFAGCLDVRRWVGASRIPASWSDTPCV